MNKNKFKIFNGLLGKKVIFFFFVFFFLALLLPAFFPALAIDLGEGNVSGIGLGNTDPRVILARIIQIVLGFLGIIVVALIIYGGFLWMTSSGNDDQVSRAKKILVNAIIGLIIILASFGIVTFVLSKIKEATGTGSSTSSPSTNASVGTGVMGNCSVEIVYPEDGQRDVPRNTSIMVTFKEAIDPTSVCNDGGDGLCNGDSIRDDGRIRLYKTNDGEDNYITNVTVSNTPDRKTFIFVPGVYLGSPTERLWYTMNLSNDIAMLDGTGAFADCRNSYLEWQFEVSNRLDLTPPQVLEKSAFPAPDNARDSVSVSSAAARARNSITVLNNAGIRVSSPASLSSSVGPNIDSVIVDPNASQGGALVLRVQAVDGVTVEMTQGGRPVTNAAFSGRTVEFDGILSLTLSADPAAGNEWTINVAPRVQADTITVGRDVYTFVAAATAANQIARGANANTTAANIVAAINNTRTDVSASAAANVATVEAAAVGRRGNDLSFSTSAQAGVLQIDHLQDGSDQEELVVINGSKDQPMNTAIQINFNEPIMPLTVSGPAADVRDYIRIVNGDPAARAVGVACARDAECISFNCTAGFCAGANDYLPGTFRISNMYKTVEFISDDQCGINGCGEAIYCLPENSILRVEIEAASLAGCVDCAAKAPYDDCVDGSCADDAASNYPADHSRARKYPSSDIGTMDGVMDAAFNSFDGDRDGFAESKGAFWNDNTPVYSADARCQAVFEEVIGAIIEKRKELNKPLGEITGSWCSSCCATDPLCEAAMDNNMRLLGFPDGAIRDYGGALFVFNENEEEPLIGSCQLDSVSSTNCGTVNIPSNFCDNGDNLSWTFFINDKLETDPPIIESLSPSMGAGTDLASPIFITLNKIAMSSTLKTGGTVVVDAGGNSIPHRNVNLWSVTGIAPGYWMTNEIILDGAGFPEKTRAAINHSLFAESVTYRAQVGSGMKDIYQNCFKPSDGPDCAATAVNPSCCNGSPESALSDTGNCP